MLQSHAEINDTVPKLGLKKNYVKYSLSLNSRYEQSIEDHLRGGGGGDDDVVVRQSWNT